MLVTTAGLVLLTFHLSGLPFGGHNMGLGHTVFPPPQHRAFLALYVLAAVPAVVLMAAGLCLVKGEPWSWPAWSERRFIVAATTLAFLIPIVIRAFVLRSAPLADDGRLYGFAAELLRSGQLTIPSHPWKLFFDRAFMVNDGRMFTQYFLGWPALLAVGQAVGLGGYTNAVLSAATVPAVYYLAKEFTGARWAQIAVILFLASPMLQVGAATQLSHTSALATLTWSALAAVRAARQGAPLWVHFSLGLLFSVAFFIRPLTALGIGLPFLAHWVRSVLTGGEGRIAKGLAFLGPAAVLAALFLGANWVHGGSIWRPAYLAFQDYASQNEYRFSGLNPQRAGGLPNLLLGPRAIVVFSATALRFNFALFGWPISVLFMIAAVGARRTALLWASLGCFAFLHLPLKDGGIDSFGPPHVFEAALPVILLSALGLRRCWAWARRSDSHWQSLPIAVAVSLVLTSAVAYWPYRVVSAAELATMIRRPLLAASQLPNGPKLIFTSHPFARVCHEGAPARSGHFVFWPPTNSLTRTGEFVWANHLDIPSDRRLAREYFPDRKPWLMQWSPECELEFLPLEEAEATGVANGVLRLQREGPIRFDPLTDRLDGDVSR